jgi:hypothetical protein
MAADKTHTGNAMMTAKERAEKILGWVLIHSGRCDTDLAGKIEAAIRAHAEAVRDHCALMCQRIYDRHRRLESYPMDLGGLAEECRDAIRALEVE